MIGTTKLRGSSMFVRRLAPQEDKLDWTTLRDGGPRAARPSPGRAAGRRAPPGREAGAEEALEPRPSARALLAGAISLAGIHEAMYLAYCELVRR